MFWKWEFVILSSSPDPPLSRGESWSSADRFPHILNLKYHLLFLLHFLVADSSSGIASSSSIFWFEECFEDHQHQISLTNGKRVSRHLTEGWPMRDVTRAPSVRPVWRVSSVRALSGGSDYFSSLLIAKHSIFTTHLSRDQNIDIEYKDIIRKKKETKISNTWISRYRWK